MLALKRAKVCTIWNFVAKVMAKIPTVVQIGVCIEGHWAKLGNVAQPSHAQPVLHMQRSPPTAINTEERERAAGTCPFTIKKREKERKKERKRGKESEGAALWLERESSREKGRYQG